VRAALPRGSLIGGAVAENHDLQNTLSAKTPLVIGLVLGLGFLLLLIALQAQLLAAVGVLTNLLATGAAFGAAFGAAKLAFQNGDLHSLFGFQPQGFLDASGPVFLFAMIFAISMDYTVFLLSSAKEHWDRTHDPRGSDDRRARALRTRDLRRRRRDGRRVPHIRALRPPAPKEMGIILGVAVLLDAALVRLLLLQVLLRLMGKWAWYLPRWAHRVLPDVTFGHA